MLSFSLAALTVALALLPLPAEAQHTKIALRAAPAPEAPWIAKAPENSTWTVEIRNRLDIVRAEPAEKGAGKPADAGGEVPPPPGSDGDIVRIYNAYGNGVQWTRKVNRRGLGSSHFVVGRFFIYENPRRDEVLVVSPQEVFPDGGAYAAGEFDGFDWIKPGNFKGVATYRGKECCVYQEWRGKPGSSANGGIVIRSAFIDQETKLPVGLEEAGFIKLYRFEPGKTMVLPERYRKALADYQERNARLERRYRIPQ